MNESCMKDIDQYEGDNLLKKIEAYEGFWMEKLIINHTRVTKKLEGSWVIQEVTFDPTSICESARPRSELKSE